ncbi:hypothetical protein T07_6532 [Trichinella nelsoni]|uniref:WDR36/Utp21 C-terminal domain-containing protein n=1 Tax=Trichinella nelsoni TaxID=6336 RepID=A0A0V0SC92_9BILA|nr:hypothetical protein T07_6532 [Trichinella nelsoni]
MSSDNNLTVISLDDFSLHLYDIFNRRMVRRFDKSHGNRITNSGVSPVRLANNAASTWVEQNLLLSQHCAATVAGYEPATVFQLPGAPFIDEKVSTEGGDEVVEQHPRQQEVTEEDGLSASRWAKLSDLDLHRQRNKPKQQLLKAGKAPFFLISTPGLVSSFDVEEEQVAQLSRLLKSPIVMSASNHEASIFFNLFFTIVNDAADFSTFHHLQSSNVSSVYSELVNLGTESGAGSERLLQAIDVPLFVMLPEVLTMLSNVGSCLGHIKMHFCSARVASERRAAFVQYHTDVEVQGVHVTDDCAGLMLASFEVFRVLISSKWFSTECFWRKQQRDVSVQVYAGTLHWLFPKAFLC